MYSLSLSPNRLVWINSDEQKNNLYLDLDSLNLFAICRDLDHFNVPCILLTTLTDQSTYTKYQSSSNEENNECKLKMNLFF